ncbi:ABC transporter ATP-binding protein [Streptomyces hirsutus]
MGQRLGLAAALLGDPPVLVLDEPVNGLDAEGIRWLRELLRSMAAEGRTVLVSSHLMTEMSLVADHLIVIDRGRLLAETGMADFIRRHGRTYVRVRTPEPMRLNSILERKGASLEAGGGRQPGDRRNAGGRDQPAGRGRRTRPRRAQHPHGIPEDTFLELTGNQEDPTHV